MGLVINKINAVIDIQRTPSKMEIKTTKAKLLLHQEHARLNMHTEMPKIEIDQSEAFASAGLKSVSELIKEATLRGYQNAGEYISKVAGDGDILAQIENGGMPLIDMAERDAYPEHEFGFDYIPKVGPRFKFTRGYVEIEHNKNFGIGNINGVKGEYIPGNIKFNYTPSVVRLYLKQYPSISFKYTGANVDTYI